MLLIFSWICCLLTIKCNCRHNYFYLLTAKFMLSCVQPCHLQSSVQYTHQNCLMAGGFVLDLTRDSYLTSLLCFKGTPLCSLWGHIVARTRKGGKEKSVFFGVPYFLLFVLSLVVSLKRLVSKNYLLCVVRDVKPLYKYMDSIWSLIHPHHTYCVHIHTFVFIAVYICRNDSSSSMWHWSETFLCMYFFLFFVLFSSPFAAQFLVE